LYNFIPQITELNSGYLFLRFTAIINAGSDSPYFMRGILKNLEDMQKLPDEDFPFRKQV
jgi:ribosomal RNA-processing protein 12